MAGTAIIQGSKGGVKQQGRGNSLS